METKEIKEVKIEAPDGYEIDEVNSTFKCIKFKPTKEVKTWEDIECTPGVWIDSHCDIKPVHEKHVRSYKDQNIFLTEKHAKAALAMAQISQLMPYYGGEVTDKEWEDNNIHKYCIQREVNRAVLDAHKWVWNFLAFHTPEQRRKFLECNERLVRDYLMLD